MSFHVYILKCADGSYYAGHTDALEKRLAQHRAGLGCDWTRRRLPVELMWTESAPTRDEALAFERRIKGWTRAKKEALIAGDWSLVCQLACSTTVRPEPVEGRSETVVPAPFDKLRTNGCPGDIRETELRTNGVSSGKDAL